MWGSSVWCFHSVLFCWLDCHVQTKYNSCAWNVSSICIFPLQQHADCFQNTFMILIAMLYFCCSEKWNQMIQYLLENVWLALNTWSLWKLEVLEKTAVVGVIMTRKMFPFGPCSIGMQRILTSWPDQQLKCDIPLGFLILSHAYIYFFPFPVCEPGYYYHIIRDACVSCPPGTFSPEPNSTTCTFCGRLEPCCNGTGRICCFPNVQTAMKLGS